MKKLVLRIIGQIASISIFVTVFLVALFFTYGYRYDFGENEVIRTSVIDICTLPKTGSLYIDDKLYSDRACEKIFGIGVGYHKIRVEKPGYYPWEKNLYLDDEKVSLYRGTLLIPDPVYNEINNLELRVDNLWVSPGQSRYAALKSQLGLIKIFSASRSAPVVLEAPPDLLNLIWMDEKRLVADTAKGRLEANIDEGVWRPLDAIALHPNQAESPLQIKGGELWKKTGKEKVLITRYSDPLESAQYFYSPANLLITTKEEIRICDFEGGNCHLIVKKDAGTPVAHPPRSKKIIYLDRGALKELSLNGPDTPYSETIL